MSREGKKLREPSLAGGCLGPDPGPVGEGARSAEPGRRACTPGDSGAGSHTCHGGLWCRRSAQSQGLHLRSGLGGSQPVLPEPARSPVGSSPEVGWGAGPSEAGPEEAHSSQLSGEHLWTRLSTSTTTTPPGNSQL